MVVGITVGHQLLTRYLAITAGPRRIIFRQTWSHIARERQRPRMQRHFGQRADNASMRTRRRHTLYAPTSKARISGPRLQGHPEGSQSLVKLGLPEKLASYHVVGVEDRLGQKAENFQRLILTNSDS